jgi:hypothetical protein
MAASPPQSPAIGHPQLGEIMPRLTPPTYTTLIISIILFLIGLLGHFAPGSAPIAGPWALIAAYIVLAIGVVVRGI